MLLADKRIELDARPTARLAPVEVVMIGHCPSLDGRALGTDSRAIPALLGEIAALGFGAEVDACAHLRRAGPVAKPATRPLLAPVPAADPDPLARPLPGALPRGLRGRFAVTAAPWRAMRRGLPMAVQDFFADDERGLRGHARALWVIRVPAEAEGFAAFLPRPDASLAEPAGWAPSERASLVERAGHPRALPDLESGR